MAQPASSSERQNFAAAYGGSDDEVMLIEEQVDSGLLELLASYQPSESLESIPYDLLDKRLEIDVNQPLPQHDTVCAKAYMAKDRTQVSRGMMALVCDPKMPLRQSTIDAMRGLLHPNLLILREAGRVKLSHSKEISYVLFFDQPAGKPISQLILNCANYTNDKLSTLF